MFGQTRWQTTNQRNAQLNGFSGTSAAAADYQKFKIDANRALGASTKASAKTQHSHWSGGIGSGAALCIASPKSSGFNKWSTSSGTVGAQTRKQPGKTGGRFDDRVLCFETYFQENVQESLSQEKHMVRQCVLRFFLEDNSMEVFERRQDNSGMTQGRFLRRMQVAKPGQPTAAYMPSDLFLGNTLVINGREFRLVKCANDFTANWYQQSEHAAPEADEFGADGFVGYLQTSKSKNADAQSMPADPYQERRAQQGLDRRKDGNFGHKVSKINQYVESSLGNTMYGINQRQARPGFNQPQMSMPRASTRPY